MQRQSTRSPCPVCTRNNAAHAVKCLYCGARMPNPTAPPPPAAERSVPEDLDQLVREAMAKGDMTKLKAAMAAQKSAAQATPRRPPRYIPPAAPVPPPAPGPPPPRFGGVVPLPLEAVVPLVDPPAPVALELPTDAVAPVDDPISVEDETDATTGVVAPAQLDPVQLSAQLSHAAAQVEAHLRHGDRDAAQAWLAQIDGIQTRLGLALSVPPPAAAPEPPAVVLPRVRHAYSLVLDGAGDGDRAVHIARALDVDVATARLVAVARHPKVARRGPDPVPLRQLAEQVRLVARLPAAVVSRPELEAIGAPWFATGRQGGHWYGTVDLPSTDPSAQADGPMRGRRIDVSGVRLVVPGDVVIRRYRVQAANRRRGRREPELKPAGERRVSVVDLHGPDVFVRLLEGVTDLRGLPGFEAGKALRSLRQFVDQLDTLWPHAVRVGPRTCPPEDLRPPGELEERTETAEATGWAEWEEHTRCCRMLLVELSEL